MGKQVQVQRNPVKRETPPADAPTVSKRLARLWFGGQA